MADGLADGLAWSFYYGYLKFVLPALKGQINETEKYRYEIDVQKLFIVIPKNCKIYDKISNEDTDPDGLIKDLENLAPLKKNRGGIQDRVYKHTVHCVTERKPGGEDRKHYCVMEYATPLKTLLNMSNDPNAGLSRRKRDQQVVLFINKLKNILDEDKDCRGKYEFIIFSGEPDQDLAEIMIDALRKAALKIGLCDPSPVEYFRTLKKEHKNLADGLAWSFYYGYLKFVLPALKDQINVTEKYRYKIDVQKLFIIIPNNCQVSDKISNEDTDPHSLIEDVNNLTALKENKGGIQARVYRHTVHCITERKSGGEDKKYYCVMEYATPLLTLLDMSNDPNAGLSKEERDQQVVLFTNKLKNILDKDKDCRGKYELITFSGQPGQDLGKIMLDALKNTPLEIGH